MLALREIGSSHEVDVNKVKTQKRMAKSKVMIFAKSKWQTFESAF